MGKPNCVVREATTKDFKSVLDIGHIYDGMDYLPYFYHDFINDPDYISFVCEVDGKIVGFGCALLHDGGRVVQMRAGRVSPAHRGNGYSKEIEFGLFRKAVEGRNIFTIWYAKESDDINWTNVDRELQTLKVFNFTMPRPSTVTCKPSNMKRLNRTQLEAIFDCRTVCQELFPRGLINVHYIALGLDKRNIKHIINENTSVYVKLSSKCDPHREMISESVTSLSVGIRYWSPAGQICELSFFGKDLDYLDDHIQAQVEEILDRDTIIMGLYVPKWFPQKKLDDMFLKFGRNNGEKLDSYDLVFVENQIQPTPKSKY